MANTSVDLFLRDIGILAKTMVVHSKEVANQVNADLRTLYPNLVIDNTQPSTWKYYMNLAGEYHETDMKRIAEINGNGNPYMTIKVAGDNASVVVDFTKDLISGEQADVALATEYAYGSNFYNELVGRYPEFETLILGILNPIEYDISIKSYNGDILYAGGWYRVFINDDPKKYYFVEQIKAGVSTKPLVEKNEYSLLYQIETWIKSMLDQWIVSDFIANPDNDLYIPGIWATLMSKLPVQIFNLRLAQIKSRTGQTHSFHYIEYLNSHGNLGKHVPYLTLDQALFLYKNMGWLETNIGKQEVFDSLVENLLTPAGVPIASYLLKQNLHELTETTYSEPFMERQYLNFKSVGVGSDARSIEEIVNKSIELARDNGLNIEDQIRQITNLSRQILGNSTPTKVLESDMMDNRDSIRYPKAQFLLNMWLYAIKHGTYRGSIFVTHPLTGQRLQLTPRNAFILMYYSFCRGFCKTTLTEFPNLRARIIPKNAHPPVATLKPFPKIEELKWCYSSKLITDQALYKLQRGILPTFKYNSTSQFNLDATAQHARLMQRWKQAMAYEDMVACGQFEWLVNKHYWFEVPIGKLTNLTMTEWLKNFGIDIDGMTDSDFRVLTTDLIKGGVGTTEHDGDWLSEMQGAVLDILEYFSSYTIQIIKTFRSGSAIRAGFKSLRLGNGVFKATIGDQINITNRQLKDITLRAKLKPQTISAKRRTTFTDVHGQQHLTLGISKISYRYKPNRTSQRINITNRMRVVKEGPLDDDKILSGMQSDLITQEILANDAVGIEVGFSKISLGSYTSLEGYQSTTIPAINGYQFVNWKTRGWVDSFNTVYPTTLSGYQSDVIVKV